MIVFNEAKPKYEKLEELLESQLLDIRFGTQVNIIIDLKELSRKFFRPDIIVDETNRGNLVTEISSDILNTIGHYRNFFFKHKRYTTFYFLYSYAVCNEFMKLFPSYKQEYYDKYINGTDPKVEIIKKAIQIVEKIISRAVPNAYFIETSDYDEFVNARYIIENIIPSNELSIIISNDGIFYQLLKENVFILEPKGIKSVLLTKDTIISVLSEGEESTLSHNSIPAILAMSGIKRYSIKSLPKVALKKAMGYLEKLKEKDLFVDLDSIEVPIKFDKLNQKIQFEKNIFDNRDSISEMYSLIRADDILYKNSVTLKSKYSSLPNSKSPAHFKELNSKIFSMYPLQTEMILKGERI